MLENKSSCYWPVMFDRKTGMDIYILLENSFKYVQAAYILM